MATRKNSSTTPRPAVCFTAAMTKKQMLSGEKAAQSWGVTRRLAYAALTRSSKQLLDGLKEGGEDLAEGMMDTLESLQKFMDWRKKETELLESAQARLMLVLQQYSDELLTQ